MRGAYYYGKDPWAVRPNYGGVPSEADWIDENHTTPADTLRCALDRRFETQTPDPCAPWRATRRDP